MLVPQRPGRLSGIGKTAVPTPITTLHPAPQPPIAFVVAPVSLRSLCAQPHRPLLSVAIAAHSALLGAGGVSALVSSSRTTHGLHVDETQSAHLLQT